MSFIDNSGDIILDAVLTDLGRELLSRGDGSFKITEFGLGDDEINYALYNAAAATNLEDVTMRQLPIFEAFTNNLIALKHRLKTMVRNDLLYMSVIKLNQLLDSTKKHASQNVFIVAVDKDSEDDIQNAASGSLRGFLGGANPADVGNWIRTDQGLDTTEVSFTSGLDTDLFETDYRVRIDNRLGKIVTLAGKQGIITTIDSDAYATYDLPYDSSATAADNPNAFVLAINNITDSQLMTIAGPRGTKLQFKIRASQLLQTQDALFTRLGGSMLGSLIHAGSTNTYRYINTSIRIEGGVTGFALDIPIKFVKKISC